MSRTLAFAVGPARPPRPRTLMGFNAIINGKPIVLHLMREETYWSLPEPRPDYLDADDGRHVLTFAPRAESSSLGLYREGGRA